MPSIQHCSDAMAFLEEKLFSSLHLQSHKNNEKTRKLTSNALLIQQTAKL